MKKLSLYFVLVILFNHSLKIYSQNQNNIDSTIIEKVNLFTDRSLYVANEKILFSAIVQSNLNESLSKVLYIELVDKQGNQIKGEKLILNNNLCNGSIHIPSDILTDIYYIKSYTKYMRNFSSDIFCYNSIKIINPNEKYYTKEEIVHSDDFQYTFNSIDSSSILNIKLNKHSYSCRDTIKVTFNKKIKDSLLFSCISVIPESTSNYQVFKSNNQPKLKEHLVYYPETRGISLTGIVKTSNKDSTLYSKRINLSIIGRNNDFMSTHFNEGGHFYFSLPDIIGTRDIFLCTNKNNNNQENILIDNDFSPEILNFKKQEFYLTDKEQEAVLNLNLNVELDQYLKNDFKINTDTLNYKNIPFYGKPSRILFIENYIQMPTVEDYINELPYHVKVRKSHGQKYLKIIGNLSDLNIFDPLVLIDMVAINDINEILSIPAQHIKQIDITNIPYVKGDIKYGGIVSLISKNNDFGGINLPNSGTFINYQFISKPDNFTTTISDPNIPDTRNTLFWNPYMNIHNNESNDFIFTTADTPGNYEIVFQGVTKDNVIFKEVIPFNVK